LHKCLRTAALPFRASAIAGGKVSATFFGLGTQVSIVLPDKYPRASPQLSLGRIAILLDNCDYRKFLLGNVTVLLESLAYFRCA
jgi:hypothetical protein